MRTLDTMLIVFSDIWRRPTAQDVYTRPLYLGMERHLGRALFE